MCAGFGSRPSVGTSWAQFNLGIAYEGGGGIQEDDVEAARCFRLAADQGFAAAQNRLGNLYRQSGLAYAEAARWFRLAADQGYADAQNTLGLLHWEGLGVPGDLVEAARWFHLAADQGHALGQDNLDKVEARMTPEQIAEAQRLAREWQPTQLSR